MSASGLLLHDAEQRLTEVIGAAEDDVDLAFVAYVSRTEGALRRLRQLAERALSRRGGERSYRDVAVLGFAREFDPSCGTDGAFADAARWLAGTSPMFGELPTGIVEDRAALLGTALALRHLDGEVASSLRTWLLRLLSPTDRDDGVNAALLKSAAILLAATTPTPSLSVAIEAELALTRLGLLPRGPGDGSQVVEAMLRGDVASEPRRAVLQLVALQEVRSRLPTLNLARASVADVGRLLRRVPVSLQQWTWEERSATRGGTARQWSIDNEYHVQSLLWALLAPVFPDLRREEYTAAVGPLQPRVDLGLPSLRLIIEVKFWRSTLSDAKLIEQIASDTSLYFSSPGTYDELTVFVWDDARRTEAHDLIERGLRALTRVADVIIVPRPGKMGTTVG